MSADLFVKQNKRRTLSQCILFITSPCVVHVEQIYWASHSASRCAVTSLNVTVMVRTLCHNEFQIHDICPLDAIHATAIVHPEQISTVQKR
jgi:hypothetical protein